MQVKQNYSLLNHNTFAIDVRANVVISYDNEDELKEMARDGFSNYPRPILHIGHGSNLLFMNDFEGTVLLSNITTIEVLKEDDTEIVVRAGAGLTMDDFIEHCIGQGWYGLENLSLIPGQVGASAVQNIGAYGVEVCDHIKRVNCVSLTDGKEISFAREECDYAYRHSIFKTPEYRGAYAVVSVEFVLNKRFTPQLAYGGIVKSLQGEGIDINNVSAKQLRDVIIAIRNDKLPDPKVQGNAGSFFMNPIVRKELFEEIQQKYIDVPHYTIDEQHVKIPAAWLIEQCGWKGRSHGKAGVHHKQPLVLVNMGGARGEDIKALAEEIQRDVNARFGIRINAEVNYIY